MEDSISTNKNLIARGINQYMRSQGEATSITILANDISDTAARISKAVREQNWGEAGAHSQNLSYLAAALKQVAPNVRDSQK